MDNNKSTNNQTNTTTPPSPAPNPPANAATPADNAAAPSAPAETAAPADPTPLVDTSATPLVDTAAAAATSTPAPSPAPAAPPNPLASAPTLEDSPILGTAPKAKQSPILNSAPIAAKKFEPKYMVPIIALAVIAVGLGVFLAVELLVLKPQAISEKESAVRASIPAATDSSSALACEECDCDNESAVSPTIPFPSRGSIDSSGSFTLAAPGVAGVSVSANSASTIAQFAVDWSQAKSAYPSLAASSGTDQYTTNFTQSITEIYQGTIGEKTFFLFLLKDGTVDYIDLEQALTTKNFEASGPIDGVSEIAKFVSATTNNNAPTILAQKIDGTYYDLTTYLE